MSSLTQEESDDDDGEMYEDLDERWWEIVTVKRFHVWPTIHSVCPVFKSNLDTKLFMYVYVCTD